MDSEVAELRFASRDLVVLDADPLERISKIRSVRCVATDGPVYDAAAPRGACGTANPISFVTHSRAGTEMPTPSSAVGKGESWS